jgi:hypothetical protein
VNWNFCCYRVFMSKYSRHQLFAVKPRFIMAWPYIALFAASSGPAWPRIYRAALMNHVLQYVWSALLEIFCEKQFLESLQQTARLWLTVVDKSLQGRLFAFC